MAPKLYMCLCVHAACEEDDRFDDGDVDDGDDDDDDGGDDYDSDYNEDGAAVAVAERTPEEEFDSDIDGGAPTLSAVN